MAFATSIATSLASGASAAATSLSGTYQFVYYGTFAPTNSVSGMTMPNARVWLELSPDDGTTWLMIPGSEYTGPAVITVDVGTGAQVRLNTANGGTGCAINCKAAAKP